MNVNYNKITPDIAGKISEIIGSEFTVCNGERIETYAHDETEDLRFYPELVVKPQNTQQIAALLRLCNKYHIPVTPRGAGTGLSGGALPAYGGVLVSMELMNNIIEIDEQNLQATIESGVITEDLRTAATAVGLLFPVDPGSKSTCLIGGNVAHGAGGPRVVKYGTIRNYILNLEVVLPSGDIIWTGANTLKYASGYDLTQLMIGAEGTLGIITKIVVKLIAKPMHTLVMLASFYSNEQACAAVSAIFRAGVTPSAVEYMERKGVAWVMEFDRIEFDLKPGVEAFLLIELDGNRREVLSEDAVIIREVLEQNACADILLAQTEAEKDKLWKIRRIMPVSVKANSVYKEEDTVVPRAKLPQLIRVIKETGQKYGFQSVCYGHAGDGNLHVNIIKAGMSDADWNTRLKDGIREIFEWTVKAGGTLSGEHGIGLVQREYMSIKYSEAHLNLMRGIKKVFDENNILNPGKMF